MSARSIAVVSLLGLHAAGFVTTASAAPPAVAWRNSGLHQPAAAVEPLDLGAMSDAGRFLGRLDPGGRVGGIRWSAERGAVTWTVGDERFHLDFDSAVIETGDGGIAEPEANGSDGGRRSRPARGRQRSSEPDPTGAWIAVARDWNVVLEPGPDAPEGARDIVVTTDGTRKFRYGMASWVYGEELAQTDAMWWSPDGAILAFYAFDESAVPDYVLLDGWTERRPTPVIEGYPKPGDPNPVVALRTFDVATGTTVEIETAGDDEQEWYAYSIRFAPGGELLFNRTNRLQNVLEVVAADPRTGKTRVVVREEQATWQDNRPLFRFLDDGKRFIWETDRSGVKRYELRHLDGRRLARLTPRDIEAVSVQRVDEANGLFWFTAYSADDPLHAQLHRVGLDGRRGKRLTPDGRSYRLSLAPADGPCAGWFIARGETVESPPRTTLHDPDGKVVAVLAEADVERIASYGYPAPERFEFTAADGETTIYGVLYKPKDFDVRRSYPLLIDVYGGPNSRAVSARWRLSHSATSLGCLVARIDNRGTGGRGKAFLGAVYRKLGDVDLLDQADGVRHLRRRPYVDGDRVGIYGHSYGGYMAALAVLKHPDVFRAASAGAPVTDWRNYDTIYTERYMGLPDDNAAGYDAGSCMAYAEDFSGDLLLLHGMMDDNVHPTNTWQLVDALQRAGKDFELMMYPEAGHGLGRHSSNRRWRFLHEKVIAVKVDAPSAEAGIAVRGEAQE